MSDRELLEMAAKAAGLRINFHPCASYSWNPLTDDGDALRLAVRLDLMGHPRFVHERDVLMFTQNTPKLEATRRAIVRAAAEIGKAEP